jgi:hypothetical protein
MLWVSGKNHCHDDGLFNDASMKLMQLISHTEESEAMKAETGGMDEPHSMQPSSG